MSPAPPRAQRAITTLGRATLRLTRLSHRCHTDVSHTDGSHTDDGHTMVTLHYGFYALCILVWPLVALLRRCAVSGWLDRAQLAGWWWWCGRQQQPGGGAEWCRDLL